MVRYSFEARPELKCIDVEVGDAAYRAWSTRYRDAKAFELLLLAFSASYGREADGAEALKLLKKA